MLFSNPIAFKEWASIVEVLGRGDQLLILRKGGIHEKGKKFDVAHSEFFLFPTFEHQNPKDLKPEGESLLKKVLAEKPPAETIPLHHYCMVEENFWISEERILKALEPFHFWSWECVKGRFEWGPERGLFGIIVRTYSLSETLFLENLKRYGGCRSWVELERPVETAALKPVLSQEVFEEKRGQIRREAGLQRTKKGTATRSL